ncbi:MAG: hypothetical protein AEth_01507 [Candidatus Argoarchaeum ethanivorans]|uniref:Transposase n=1 Tax=Candidatus Argoarchaeum ethanivorans TaxID=2608793 RepID=A0A8B3S0Z7_9EURY|nr:MAG: hypothetical protein AEth_01507 [Candidatus Argoarchaeum ethanivorans]
MESLTDHAWNPIEFIWKSIKKVISREFIVDLNHMKEIIIDKFRKYSVDLNHMKEIIIDKFRKYSSQISFAKGWIEKFIDEEHKLEILGS